jgi:1,4-dihydroxy-2-naphthoyl-CoA hydrolase
MSDEADQFGAGLLDDVLGFERFEFDGETIATAEMPVVDAVKQPFGIVHGGAYAGLAESLCSRATFQAVSPEMAALGQANETLFLRPVFAGTVHARARALHRGRTSWVWDVEMTDDDGRLCATSRLITAVREFKGER